MDEEKNLRTEENVSHGFADINNPQNVALLLKHGEIFDRIEDYLRGKRYDFSMKKEVISNQRVNEQGISVIMSEFEVRCTKIFSTTSFKENHVQALMFDFTESFVKLLIINRDNFGIKKEDVRPIFNLLADSYYAVLNQAQGDNMKKFLKNTFRATETRSINDGRGLFKGGFLK